MRNLALRHFAIVCSALLGIMALQSSSSADDSGESSLWGGFGVTSDQAGFPLGGIAANWIVPPIAYVNREDEAVEAVWTWIGFGGVGSGPSFIDPSTLVRVGTVETVTNSDVATYYPAYEIGPNAAQVIGAHPTN